jgi:DNA-binding XRE family transcriptional regulator
VTTSELLKQAQTIRTPSGEEMVLIPKAVFDELRDAIAESEEDADDVAIYDARKAEIAACPPMPAEVTMALLKGERRIKAIRQWRNVTQAQLASAVGITQGHLSDLETGRRSVTAGAADAIARTLDVPPGWLED